MDDTGINFPTFKERPEKVDIDMDIAESMRVDPTGFSPRLSREDGSFTNW